VFCKGTFYSGEEIKYHETIYTNGYLKTDFFIKKKKKYCKIVYCIRFVSKKERGDQGVDKTRFFFGSSGLYDFINPL